MERGEGGGGGESSKRPKTPPDDAQEHVLVERKHYQELVQKLLQLTSLIPAFNKIEGESIVEEAAEYIKQLENHVKLLEQQMREKTTGLDGTGSSSYSNDQYFDKICPENIAALEIKANISGKEILIKIYNTQKDYNLVPKIFSEISKLRLRLLNSNIMSVGNAFDITITVQIEGQFCMTMEHLVKHLRQALQ